MKTKNFTKLVGKIFSLLSISLFLFSNFSFAADLVKVIKVVDGDTAIVQFLNGKVERVRLSGIDTPELGTYEGDLATLFVRSKIEKQWVHLEHNNSRDKYGRLLGNIKCHGEDLGETLVNLGYANKYIEKNAPTDYSIKPYPFRATPKTGYSKDYLILDNASSDNKIYVPGYFRKSGTYVRPHYRSSGRK